MPLKLKRLSRFKTSERGATAVEFALLAPVFVYVLMGIIEVSLFFFASANLDGAAIDAARLVRTGQAQSSADPEDTFYTEFCGKLFMFSCGDVFYDVRTVSDFSSADVDYEIDEDTGEPVTYGFSSGGASDIVVIRAMAFWEFNTPLIGQFFENSSVADKRFLISTVAFQSEPYE